MPQETYSLADLDESVDEERTSTTNYAPLDNMLSAAHLVVELLVAQQRRIHALSGMEPVDLRLSGCYGILGGFSMQLRGGRQSTRDIDMVTSIKMKGVWDAIDGEDRIVVPNTRLIEGVLKTFVKTGPPWDACTEPQKIEVDIKQAGFRKVPRDFHNHLDRVGPFDVFGKAVYFNVLDILSMLRIKVECCLSRAEQRDFADVKRMVMHHTDVVLSALQKGKVDEEELLEVIKSDQIGDQTERQELKRRLTPPLLHRA